MMPTTHPRPPASTQGPAAGRRRPAASPGGRWRRGGLAALLGAAAVAAAMAAEPAGWQALAEPPSQERHVGKLIFVELATPDLPAAEQFYAALFGWAFRDLRSGGMLYAEASLEGRPVAGLVHRKLAAGERRQPAWLGFIAVKDADAARKAAVQQGARVLSEPRSVRGHGREAVFADPQGAVFGVLASSSGDPPDVLAAPGEWIWSSLLTRDLEAGTAFYQALFDYEVFDLSEGDGGQHVLFASDEFARASANAMPSTWPQGRSHWLNYVRVIDADKAVARAVALGGRVLIEPRVDRHGGKVAVVADPQGAPVGLLEWPEAPGPKGAP